MGKGGDLRRIEEREAKKTRGKEEAEQENESRSGSNRTGIIRL